MASVMGVPTSIARRKSERVDLDQKKSTGSSRRRMRLSVTSRYKDGTTKACDLAFLAVPYRALQSDRCLVITACDAASRRITMTATSQATVNDTFDNANRMTQLSQGATTVAFGYDNVNRRATLTLPNGVTATYSYDLRSKVTGITYQLGRNTIGNLAYTYDASGRRVTVSGSVASTNLPGAIASATYNANNQLTNWNGTALSYDLDCGALAFFKSPVHDFHSGCKSMMEQSCGG